MSFLHQAVIFLVATVVMVPLFKRLALGSVLGYLAAGVVIGPYGIGLVSDVESILHFAELGVVLFLFVIGLELQPSRLWELRRVVFGLGTTQMVATTVVVGAVALALGVGAPVALVAGVGLSCSSTAFALQLLAEKNQLTRDYGQASFGILLFQDLAVIPMLAIMPLLGGGGTDAAANAPIWLSAAKIVGVLAVVFLGGRYVVRPIFRTIANLHSQELMTAAALLIVVGTALLVSAVGLSMSLGAFLAGVLLAGSEYKHELETDIEPFKGLLLGLFFIAVGMSANVGLLSSRPLLVIALVVGLTAVKLAVLFGIGRRALGASEPALSLGVVLSQGGEFAFVLFNLAVAQSVMDAALADLLIVVVTLSMALTPLLYLIHERLVRPRFATRVAARAFDVPEDDQAPVIIAGFGRVGQVVGRVLRARRIRFTALDISPEHIDFIRRFGNKVFYGDAGRLDLLRSAGAGRAKIFVLAVDTPEASLKIGAEILEHFPNLTIYARARNRQHAYRLLDLGIHHVYRETIASSVELTEGVLEGLGMPQEVADETVRRFRELDERMLLESYQYQHDMGKLTEMANRARVELEQLFEKDEEAQRRDGG
jgi:glutathione-regulated potassium-efflux system ancillary protein KefC